MKALFTSLIFLGMVYGVKAQDSIRVTSGKVIYGTVVGKTPYEVTYRKQRLSRSKYYVTGNKVRMSTSKITEIIYANGSRDTVMPLMKHGNDTGARYFDKDNFYRLGANDAALYYHNYTGATTGTLLATILGSPLVGAIVATSTSLSNPNPHSLTYPNGELLKYESYRDGYSKKARHMKAGNVWINWGIGCFVSAAFYLMLTHKT
jgi:hypothetical protein